MSRWRRCALGAVGLWLVASVVWAQEIQQFFQRVEFYTNPVYFGRAVTLLFEGTTVDGNETTLRVTDPTADRTITFPDASGTVALTGGGGGGSGLNEYDITAAPYNAVCDGTTDDSTAIAAAITAAIAAGGGTLRLPIGSCAFGTGLSLDDGNNSTYTKVNIVGQSENLSVLKYTGSGTAITLSQVAYFHWQDFALQHPGSHGSTIGMLLTGPGGTTGTQTLSGTFTHVAISGFHIGMQAGNDAGTIAASEIDCMHCIFDQNDIGWTAKGLNSLNYHFWDLILTSNAVGLQMGSSAPAWQTDGPTVHGGSASGSTTADFYFENTFSETRIFNFRSETANRFLSGSTPSKLNVQGCIVTASTNGDAVLIDITGAPTGAIDLNNNYIDGKFQLGAMTPRSELRMFGNQIREGSTGRPFTIGSSGFKGGRIALESNTNITTQTPFADVNGAMSGESISNQIVPYFQTNHNDDTRPMGGLQLNRVRAIALGSAVEGKNLRDTVTFSASGTAAFTFSRTVSVGITSGSFTITFSANAIGPMDIGKKITIVQASNACGSLGGSAPGTFYGTITTIVSSTSATVTNSTFNQTTPQIDCEPVIQITNTRNATIGENEPDTNWRATGLACNANETFYVDSTTYATTGVTFKSSNAASNATCNFLVTR